MSKFGVLKTKILNKLTESYSQQNKTEVKSILSTIKENKDFKEMYLFYEEIENKYFDDKETAQLFVEGIGGVLRQSFEGLEPFCNSLDKQIGTVEINENEIYSALDQLMIKDSLSNVEKKVIAKKKLVEHLTTKKNIKVVEESTLVPNETLLNAVLANNFNVLYSNTLNEEQKGQLKNILSLSYDDILTQTTELKESILNQVDGLLKESTETDLTNKLNNVQNEVKNMTPSRYNYYRLTELKNGLN